MDGKFPVQNPHTKKAGALLRALACDIIYFLLYYYTTKLVVVSNNLCYIIFFTILLYHEMGGYLKQPIDLLPFCLY